MKKIVAGLVVALSLSFTTAPLAQAGCPGGPRGDTTICPAFGTVTYFETFRGGELASVAIVGDGSTDLDIFVYDMQDRLVARGIGPTDIELATWFPVRTQTYRMVVRNLGATWNRYGLATD